MRACVLQDVRKLVVRELPAPAPGARDVLVRVAAVGLCGTDYHIYSGEGNYNTDESGKPRPLSSHPQILGHEIAGEIAALGKVVSDLREGDRVILDQGLNCVSHNRAHLCEYCASGDSHQCEFYAEHGITGLPGGLAEFVCLPAVNAIRVESSLDTPLAALAEPLSCVTHAMNAATGVTTARYQLNAAEPARRARAVLIFGAGPAGLLFTQYVRRVLGFDGLLLVSEPNARKREMAASFGADVVDPSREDLVEVVRERTDGRMVELAIDSSGAGAIFPVLPRVIRKQATVLLYGHGHGGADMSLLNGLQFKEPVLVSPVGASGGFDPDGRPTVYRKSLQLIENGTIQVEPFISHRYRSLDDVDRAFQTEFTTAGYSKGIVQLT